MKTIWTKWTSLAVIFSMLLSLLPAVPVLAAGRILISNISTVETSPSMFTTNSVPLTATIEGIEASEIANIYFVIENPATGQVITDTANKAVQNPTDPYQITFEGVELTQGKNKITIRLDGANSIVTQFPGWAIYTPVTNIQNLQFGTEEFIDDPTRLYPNGAPYAPVEITGTAPNATRIDAYLTGQESPVEGFIDTNKAFSFLANSTAGNDLTFNPGDNELTLVATNGSNTFYTKRRFAYDNGQAIAYNAKIGAAALPLVTSPTITTTTADVTAYLKVPIDTVTGNVYAGYRYLNVDLNADGTVYQNIDLQNPPASTVTLISTRSNYKVFQFTGNIDISVGATKYRDLQFVFHNGSIAAGTSGSTYTFTYENPDEAYISRTTWVIGKDPISGLDVEVSLSPNASTAINVFPAILRVYTNTNTLSILPEVNGTVLKCIDPATGSEIANCTTPAVNNNGTPADPSDDYRVYTVKVEGLQDGFAQLKITPFKAADRTSPNEAGSLLYNIVITASPYVILESVFEGRTIKSSSELTCAGVFPCIAGSIVNFPLNLTAPYMSADTYFQFTINGKVFPVTSINVTDPVVGTFRLPIADADIVEGKNVIKISIVINGSRVSEQTVNIFKYEFPVPVFDRIVPVDSTTNPQFTLKETDTYVTKSDRVSFSGFIKSFDTAGDIRNITLKVRPSGLAERNGTVSIGAYAPTTSFTTGPETIPLGENLFEFTATNKSNVSVIKTIKIIRENLPYVIQSPRLTRNAKGLDQATVNSNFVEIVIRAEGADKVLIGKNEARYDSVQELFTYELQNLKTGENKVSFTVMRGEDKADGQFIVYNSNTPIEGATFKSEMKTKIAAFNSDFSLEFPRNTAFMRNLRDAENQYLTADRKLLVGIANNTSGKLLRTESSGSGQSRLSENRDRFRPASKLFWIDAGTISSNAQNDPVTYAEALTGSGRSPYSGTNFYSRRYEDLVVPTQTGKLTLKYDSSISTTAWNYISVFHYDVYEDANGVQYEGWKNLGGIMDTKKNTITVPLQRFGFYQVMYMDESYNDITAHPYARDDLDTLYAKGYMKARSRSTFGVYEPMTRGEFAQLLVKIFEIPLRNEDTAVESFSGQGTFTDVILGRDYGLYDADHIEAAARAGIMRGSVGGRSEHNRAITREQAAVMIARAGEYKMGTNLASTTAALQKLFTDANSIDDYAKPAIEAIAKAGLIAGRPNVLLEGQTKETLRFDPQDTLRRDDAGVIAMRVLRAAKKLPR